MSKYFRAIFELLSDNEKIRNAKNVEEIEEIGKKLRLLDELFYRGHLLTTRLVCRDANDKNLDRDLRKFMIESFWPEKKEK